jgi:hypothetical protein
MFIDNRTFAATAEGDGVWFALCMGNDHAA